jgi:hypothetical protein
MRGQFSHQAQRQTKAKLALSLSTFLGATALASAAFAQDTSPDWQFRASLYGFLPDVSSTAALPTGSTDIEVEADDLLDHTDAAFMGLIEAQHGRFGLFADAMYFKLGNSVQDTTQVAYGGGTPLPPGITLDADAEIKMWVFTLAGTYRIYQSQNSAIDLFGGARVLQLDTNLDYAFNVPFGPFSGPMQTGSAGASMNNVDGIVGVKGRTAFGSDRAWFVQYYADVGAGDSELTWQAFGGVGRSIGPVDLVAGYRHLSYEFGDDSGIEDVSFDGPVIGASFNF